MNPANPNPPAQGQEQQQQRPSVMKMILIYMVINYIFGNFFGGNKGQQQAAQGGSRAARNLFYNDEPLEFQMFISNSSEFDNTSVSVWQEKGIAYNFEKENYREKTLEFNIDELLSQTNMSLYAHFVLSSLRSPTSENYEELSQYLLQVATINLIDWRKKDANLDQENLLFTEEKNTSLTPAESLNVTQEGDKYPHLRSKVWIQLIHDTNAYIKEQLPEPMRPEFVNTTNGIYFYVPTLDVSQFWARKKDFVFIDPEAQNRTLNTTFYFNTYWIYKYMLESQMKTSGSMYSEWGMGDNLDEIKEMVLDSNPYLFAVTIIVSTLHSLFEFLAIKNEIAFWKNLESHKGLSLRTLWVSLVTEVIVFLYLLDNDTSFLILASTFVGLGVTIWKIIKTTKFKRKPNFPFVELDYQDAYKSTTQQYDQVASKYLFWLFVPLLAGYTVYSLVYEKHKGWYSFVVQTLVGFIYVFGFIEMTPQLYINYKLKSVEHLPWRVLIYKFLNTIVDDLFAFVITMPWLKRLSCFRDDIIFLIYLYQRWIYRVDKTRDPYGTGKDSATDVIAGTEDEKTKALPTTKKRMGASSSTVTQRNTGSKGAAQQNNENAAPVDNKKTN